MCASMTGHLADGTILVCCQMGKFYELFHNDAVIAVKELGLIYMKVSCPVTGLLST